MANTLKVTITEDIILDGQQQGGSWSNYSSLNVNHIYKTTGWVPNEKLVNLLTFNSSSFAGNNLEVDGVKYLRITNKLGFGNGNNGTYTGSNDLGVNTPSTGQVLRIRISGSAAGEVWHSIGPGDSFLLSDLSSSFSAFPSASAALRAHPITGSLLTNIDSIDATSQGPSYGGCSYEIFAAATTPDID